MEYATTDHLTKEEAQELGSFYTPKDLAEDMAKKLNIQPKENLKILDPCVGKGNLLVAIKNIYPFVKDENLYGIDIDKEAIRYCRKKFPQGHFIIGDVLSLHLDVMSADDWKLQEKLTDGELNKKEVKLSWQEKMRKNQREIS